MAEILNPNNRSYIYFLVKDRIWDRDDNRMEETTYGMARLPIRDYDKIRIVFHNDIDIIPLSIHPVTRSEWETMKTFKLFPVLEPYVSEWHLEQDETLTTKRCITFRVRFRDF